MIGISYRRHRFPPIVIQHAVWFYLRFTLSYRDVEDLLAERGLDISDETVRSWVQKFGPVIARPVPESGRSSPITRGAHANQPAAGAPRRPSAIRSLPWQTVRRNRDHRCMKGGLP